MLPAFGSAACLSPVVGRSANRSTPLGLVREGTCCDAVPRTVPVRCQRRNPDRTSLHRTRMPPIAGGVRPLLDLSCLVLECASGSKCARSRPANAPAPGLNAEDTASNDGAGTLRPGPSGDGDLRLKQQQAHKTWRKSLPPALAAGLKLQHRPTKNDASLKRHLIDPVVQRRVPIMTS
jgi:hypothetical protein